ARTQMHEYERIGSRDALGDRLDVGDDTGGGVGVREEDDLGAPHLLELRSNLVGVGRLAPPVAKMGELAAVDLRLRREALAEEAVRDDEDRVARRAEVLETVFHAAGARRGQVDDVVLRAEPLLQPLGYALEGAAEVGRSV